MPSSRRPWSSSRSTISRGAAILPGESVPHRPSSTRRSMPMRAGTASRCSPRSPCTRPAIWSPSPKCSLEPVAGGPSPRKDGFMTKNIIRVTPFMHVPDLEEALALLVDILGFRVDLRFTDYAYVSREGAALRILQSGREPMADDGRYAYYFDVRDVDALHAELKPSLDTLPDGHVSAPTDQPYRQRELVIRASDGQAIVFGQAIGP